MRALYPRVWSSSLHWSTKNMECPYCHKKFNSWLSVAKHTSTCSLSNKEYCVDKLHGPIHYSEFNSRILSKYPGIKTADYRKRFKKLGFHVEEVSYRWNKDTIAVAINLFHKEYSRVPQARDFENNQDSRFPGRSSVQNIFKTWNEAILYAGLTPNYNDGFGNRVTGLDGILYRSNFEAKFSNDFLFNKENYIYELKYPNHNKYYDFYLPDRDIYIEIDGGLRPGTIKEKIEINKELGRKLLVITTNTISTFSWDKIND